MTTQQDSVDVEREAAWHGLGPSAIVVEDEPDGFVPVAMLVGTGNVYLQQGRTQMFLGFKQARALLAALSRRLSIEQGDQDGGEAA